VGSRAESGFAHTLAPTAANPSNAANAAHINGAHSLLHGIEMSVFVDVCQGGLAKSTAQRYTLLRCPIENWLSVAF
jgi:hypothetical protein